MHNRQPKQINVSMSFQVTSARHAKIMKNEVNAALRISPLSDVLFSSFLNKLCELTEKCVLTFLVVQIDATMKSEHFRNLGYFSKNIDVCGA